MPLYCREQVLLNEVGLWWYADQYPNTLFSFARRAYEGLRMAGIQPSREDCEVALVGLIRVHEPMLRHLRSPKYGLAREVTLNAYLLTLARCVLHSYWTQIERAE